jgi:hypothetical protein
MLKKKPEDVKKIVDALKASVAKAKELAKGNKYDPLFRNTRLDLKRAQRKFDQMTGKKLARHKRK